MENGAEEITEPTRDHILAADELAAVATQLAEEKKARAELEQSIAGKDARIAELEGSLSEFENSLSEAKQAAEAATAELATIKLDRDEAVAKYLGMAKALNPGIPGDIITGSSIKEIDAAVEKGRAIVEAVKAAIEAEAATARVPAGAPPRAGTPGIEGMSPREKIAYGTRPKGGVS
jgi:septal ring factor EnvC (AmiA/AmiB activator)